MTGRNTALVARPDASGGAIISVGELKSRSEMLLQAMKAVMREGTHFGSVGGTNRPFLWKAGAEKLQVLFGLTVSCEVIESRVTAEEVYFRVKATCSAADGRVLAVQEGACSTGEDKYGWREAICPEEYDEAEQHMRRVKWKKNKGKNGDPFIAVRQVRHDPGEQLNTILQMAQKRGSVASVRSATGASDIFALESAGEDDVPEATGKVATEKDLRVVGVRHHDGTNDRGPWRLFFVKLSDNRECSTFSKDHADLAETAFRHNYAVKCVATESTKKPGEFKIDIFELVPA